MGHAGNSSRLIKKKDLVFHTCFHIFFPFFKVSAISVQTSYFNKRLTYIMHLLSFQQVSTR